jgi:hypothetical protein
MIDLEEDDEEKIIKLPTLKKKKRQDSLSLYRESSKCSA